MRVLFIPWGQATHYFHMVPLAWAFRAAGHDVRIAAQPGAVAAVTRSGLTVSRIGRDYDLEPDARRAGLELREELSRQRAQLLEYYRRSAAGAPTAVLEPPRPAAPARPFRESPTFVNAATASAGDLARLARSWRPDLVIADPFALAAPIAAHLAGAPLVHQLWGPAVHRQFRDPAVHHIGSGRPLRWWPDELTQLYERFGVPPRAESAVGTVDGCPDGLQYPGLPGRIPMRYVPYNGPGAAPAWLLEPPVRPRICVTWGTLTSATAGDGAFLVPRVIEVLGRRDVEVVVTVNAAELPRLGDPPPGFRYVSNLPLHLLLPTCSAIVHQGGAGATLTAAALGVPQLPITGLLDQSMNGKRVARYGAGVVLDWAEASADAIDHSVTEVLSERCRRRARQLRDETAAQPPPAEVVRELEHIGTRSAA